MLKCRDKNLETGSAPHGDGNTRGPADTTVNTLEKLEKYLKSVPLARGWEWEKIGLDPNLGGTGTIVLALKNSGGGSFLKIALIERDDALPYYKQTVNFNITVLRGAGESISPREMKLVESVCASIGLFDRGEFEYPVFNRSDGAENSEIQALQAALTSVIREYESSGSGAPGRDIIFVLPSRCNWDCVFCRSNLDSEPEQWIAGRDILIEARKRAPEWKKNRLSISITGNEPLNNEIFIDLAEFALWELAGSRNIIVQTTGAGLDDPEFVSRLPDLKRIFFDLPIYGPDAATHDSVTRAPGSFDRILKLLGDSRFNIRALTIVLQKNIGRLCEIRDLCVSLGRPISFIILYTHDDSGVYLSSAPRISEAVDQVRAVVSDDEFALFAFYNRERIPPCISKIALADAVKDITGAGSDGCKSSSYYRDKVGADLIPCISKNQCSFGKFCPGVYETYVSHYGWSEFKPVR